MTQHPTRTAFHPFKSNVPSVEHPAPAYSAGNHEPGTKPATNWAERRPEQNTVGCRWIDGDVGSGQWRYCQRPRVPGKSYCATHHLRSVDPARDREFTVEQISRESHLTGRPLLDEA